MGSIGRIWEGWLGQGHFAREILNPACCRPTLQTLQGYWHSPLHGGLFNFFTLAVSG